MNSKGQNARNFEPDGETVLVNARFRTLVADGNYFFSGFLEKYLEADDHLILTSDSAEDTMAKTRQFQPDLILLDSGLDERANLELLSELLMEQASAAVIVLARDPTVPGAVEAIRMGALDYLEQPLDPQKLKLAIKSQKMLFKGPVPDER